MKLWAIVGFVIWAISLCGIVFTLDRVFDDDFNEWSPILSFSIFLVVIIVFLFGAVLTWWA